MQKLKAQVKLAERVFVAETASLIGEISIGKESSVWYGAVLRADYDSITIGEGTNVQDNVVCHVDPGFPMLIGNENVIGHSAILHGCTIGNNNLIGMRATIMNGVQIGNGCIIGAHALVTEGMEIPDFSMVLGMPGKIVKQLPESIIEKINRGVIAYKTQAARYLDASGE